MTRCKLCRQSFEQRNRALYCSEKCRQRWKYLAAKEKAKPRTCMVCQKEYKSRNASQRTCSYECFVQTDQWKESKRKLDDSQWHNQ